jgi:hypothetical protein
MGLRDDLRVRVDAELTDVAGEIDRILVPAQRQRFQQFVFKMRMRLETPATGREHMVPPTESEPLR